MVTDCHSILARWRNDYCQLQNVHEFIDARQTEICTAEPILPEPSIFQNEKAIEMLKRHKSSDFDSIPAELIKTGGRTIRCDVSEINNYIWNMKELREEQQVLIRVRI